MEIKTKTASLIGPNTRYTYDWSACGSHEASKLGYASSSDVEAVPWCQTGASV